MSRNRYIESLTITPTDLDYTNWPDVHIDPRDETFEKRKKAVQLYLDHKCTLREIENDTGIQRKEINLFVKRCLQRDQNNRLLGFKALIPHKRSGTKYSRCAAIDGFNHDSSLTGAFQQLLEKYPQLNELIKDYILSRKRRKAADNFIRVKDLRTKFLKLARALGIQLNEYPFNTQNMCLRSLYRHVDKLITENMEIASGRFSKEAERITNRFDGRDSGKDLIVPPFQSIQMDGHKIDVHLTVKFTNAYGDEVVEVLKRIWFICLMDEGTRAVISHHLCIRSEYSSVDLLHTFKKGITPWEPLSLTIPELEYPDKPFYPSMAFEEAKWALWDELKCDNALANISNIVEDRLTKIVNCSINPGQAHFPEGRGIIERFFGLLEEDYLHRLSMTTGSTPKDHRNEGAINSAKKYELHVEELEQLIEVAVARYNTEPHPKFGISPLDVMEQRIKYRGMVPRQLNEHERTDIKFFTYQVNRIVRGSKKSGTRPYINFEGERYTSTLLAKNFSLIGEKLILDVNIDDICVLKAYLSDGQELDFIKVKGPWGKQPHSLKTRQSVNRLVRENQLRFDDTVDPIDAFSKYLEEKAEKNKKYRNELVSQRRYQQKNAKPIFESGNTLETQVGFGVADLLHEEESDDQSDLFEMESLLKDFKTIC